jgi:hypothetical protein
MADAHADADLAHHPAPQRDRVGSAALLFGLCGAPAGWGLQLVANYALASHVCFPCYRPLTNVLPGWGSVWSVLFAIELAALALALAGGLTAYRTWQTTKQEGEGDTEHLVEVGHGRTRFLSLWGLLTSLGFTIAIAFSLTGLFMVPLCGF